MSEAQTETGPDIERDEARDFENDYQDMPVDAKTHPALGPTEEAQNVSQLNRIVVPMGAFADPSNPAALAGSVNLALDKHPVTHAEDYGVSNVEGVGVDVHSPHTPADAGTEAVAPFEPPDFSDGQPDPETARGELGAQAAARRSGASSADRTEWKKADWVTQARALGLSTSGNMDAVKDRVEAHEEQEAAASAEREDRVTAAKEMNAGDWIEQIESADEDELQELQSLYAESGADYSTVQTAIENRQAALADES